MRAYIACALYQPRIKEPRLSGFFPPLFHIYTIEHRAARLPRAARLLGGGKPSYFLLVIIITNKMKRRKTVLAAAFCFSFCLGTLMNVLFVPGFEPHQSHDAARQRSFIETRSFRLHVSDDFAPVTASIAESSSSATLSDLRLQIRGRLGEVLRYQSGVEDAAARSLERRRLMDLERASSWDESRAAERSEGDHARGNGARQRAAARGSGGALGCGTLERASSVQFVGSGYTKAVYRAELNTSFSVALKSVDLSGHDMESCVKRYSSAEDCYRLASFKIIKEMTLMERLQHPNILKVNLFKSLVSCF